MFTWNNGPHRSRQNSKLLQEIYKYEYLHTQNRIHVRKYEWYTSRGASTQGRSHAITPVCAVFLFSFCPLSEKKESQQKKLWFLRRDRLAFSFSNSSFEDFIGKISQPRTFSAVWTVLFTKEFKKLRRQLQGKRHIKIELFVKLSLLRLFHVDHVVQNRRSALSLAWHEWFSCKGKQWKNYTASARCRHNLKYENFTSSFGRLRQNIAPKSVVHVQHDYLSSFNQSNHWFVALSLTSSNLKFPNIYIMAT